jgi:hypothetical protein
MTVSIMQPAYLPWLGYFHRIAMSDLHIVLDHVAIDRNSKTKFANRNKVRTKEGWTWLTIPLLTRGRSDQLGINQLEIDETAQWQRKHWNTIRHSYGHTPHFSQHADFLQSLFDRPWRLLIDVQRELTEYLLPALGITTPILFSSSMATASRKDELILDLCRESGATEYISGPFGRDYLKADDFDQAGIRLSFHDYHHPVYQQAFDGFEPYMSAIDLLFNHGSASAEILHTEQEQKRE